MSTATQEPATEHIPDEVETGGPSRWRATAGKFRKGPGDGDEVKDQLHGRLVRFGFYDGEDRNGKRFEQFEVDLDLNGKIEGFKTNFNTLTSTFGVMLAMRKLNIGDLVIVKPNLGTKENSHGKKPTFMNIYKGKIEDGKVKTDVELRDRWEGEFNSEGARALLAEIKQLPGYKERPRKADADPNKESAWDRLVDTIAKGDYWRPIDQVSEPAYLEFMSFVVDNTPALKEECFTKKLTVPFTKLADVPDSVFDVMRLGHDAAKAAGRPARDGIAKVVANSDLF